MSSESCSWVMLRIKHLAKTYSIDYWDSRASHYFGLVENIRNRLLDDIRRLANVPQYWDGHLPIFIEFNEVQRHLNLRLDNIGLRDLSDFHIEPVILAEGKWQ